METTFIYMLICPIDNQVKYVGKANNVPHRVKDHMLDLRGVSKEKAEWILELRKAKLKPIVEILDEVSVEDWKYWEAFWMEYFISLGCKLLGKRCPGRGLTYSNSMTFKKNNIPWNKGKIKMGDIYV